MSNVSKKKSFNFVLLVSILGVGSLLVGLLSFYLLKLRKNSLEKEKEILETKNKLKLNSPSKTTSENSAKPEETASEDQKEPTEFSELPPPKTRSKLGVSFNPEDKIHYLDRVSENPFVTSREPSRYPESILKTSKIPKLKKRNDSRLSKSVFAPSSVETITEEPFLVLNPNGEDFPLQEDPSNFSMMKLENFEELKRDFKKHWEKLSSKSRKALDFFNWETEKKGDEFYDDIILSPRNSVTKDIIEISETISELFEQEEKSRKTYSEKVKATLENFPKTRSRNIIRENKNIFGKKTLSRLDSSISPDEKENYPNFRRSFSSSPEKLRRRCRKSFEGHLELLKEENGKIYKVFVEKANELKTKTNQLLDEIRILFSKLEKSYVVFSSNTAIKTEEQVYICAVYTAVYEKFRWLFSKTSHFIKEVLTYDEQNSFWTSRDRNSALFKSFSNCFSNDNVKLSTNRFPSKRRMGDLFSSSHLCFASQLTTDG